MLTENFTRALQLTHNFNPSSTSSHERLEAERYLMELRERPEGLNLSFHIISNETVDEVRCFWAFNTIMYHLPALAAVGTSAAASLSAAGQETTPAVDDAQAEELYRTLFSFIYRYLFSPQPQQSPSSPVSDFLMNKHAQLMVVGLQCFYPHRWRCFFEDLFDLLLRSGGGAARPPHGDAVAVYFLRIFEYIDERVVSVRERTLQERGKDVRARDMALKDAMRVQVVPRLVQTWYAILSEVRHRAPDIAYLCLSVVQTYVEWIDVSLIMTADWINLFYFTMTVPPTLLRVAACECILSLVAKKQLPGMKMESLRTLSVVASLPRIVSMLNVPPTGDEDVSLIDAVARLVVAVAEQFLQLFDICASSSASGSRPPSTVLIDAETGMNMADIPFDVSPDLMNSLADALHAVVAQLLRIYSIPGLLEVREVCLPLMQNYLKSQVLQEHEAAEILMRTFDHMRVEGIAVDEGKVFEDGIIDHRKILFNVVRLLYRRFPSLVMQHLCAVVMGVVQERNGSELSSSSSSHNVGDRRGAGDADSAAARDSLAHINFTHPEVVEAALHYVYEIGAAVKLETTLKDPADPVTMMMAQLLTCNAVAVKQTNACVHLAFFECLERYHLFFVFHAECIPVLLQRFLLLPCGVTNRNSRVRARICYLFSRMLQMLKGAMRPYAADMVHAIMAIVNTANAQQLSQSGHAFRRASAEREGELLPNDLRELYEATGTLLALLLADGGGGGAVSLSRDGGGGGVGNGGGGSLLQQNGHQSGLPRQPEGQNGGLSDTVVSADDAQDTNGDATYCATLTQAVVDGVLQHLQHVSSSDTGARMGTSVADAMSYLSALAKGMSLSEILNAAQSAAGGGGGGGANISSSSTKMPSLAGSFDASSGGAASSSQRTALRLAQLFASVTEQHVMPVLSSPWRGAAAVRDAGGQFFQQMINTIPLELITAAYEAYVELTLSAMEGVPELGRLLRLMYQFVNKSGGKGIPTVVRVTPVAWAKVLSLGELSSAASPVMYLGVISESAREKVDVYRQFFSYVFSLATWGCAPALLLLPEDCLSSILGQLVDAVTLPIDLELPKAALQTLTKLTTELFGPAPSPSSARLELHVATLAGMAPESQLRRSAALIQYVLLQHALPMVFRTVMRPRPPPTPPMPPAVNNASASGASSSGSGGMSAGADDGAAQGLSAAFANGDGGAGGGGGPAAPPSSLTSRLSDRTSGGLYFDLSDGKSFLFLGEVGLFCKACSHSPFAESALECMYTCLVSSGRIPTDAAMGFCCAVRDQPRFSSSLKLQFKQMLERAQQQQE